MKKTYLLNEWFTVQDCLGLPFFPTSANNIRRNLEKMVKSTPGAESEKMRKKPKGKGYEYHRSILPPHLLDAVAIGLEREESSIANPCPQTHAVDNFAVWTMIYNKLTPRQQQRAIDLFFEGGINALLPTVVFDVATDNNGEQEILCHGHSVESSNPAPEVSSRSKKAS
ncbi:hypothetical protein ITQ64_001388 [Salmonella enterica subsp. enterica serovar Java]|nr:hypothetical protein [Salmonella enterica subsp. enterica serovar Java]